MELQYKKKKIQGNLLHKVQAASRNSKASLLIDFSQKQQVVRLHFNYVTQQRNPLMPFLTFRLLSLLGESCELDPAAVSSAEDSFFLLFSSSKTKVEFLELAALLARAFVLLPVVPVCIDTLGALTTKDESNLSFFFGCGGAGGKTSGASIFLLLRGKILALMSCKLWSGLQVIKEECKV